MKVLVEMHIIGTRHPVDVLSEIFANAAAHRPRHGPQLFLSWSLPMHFLANIEAVEAAPKPEGAEVADLKEAIRALGWEPSIVPKYNDYYSGGCVAYLATAAPIGSPSNYTTATAGAEGATEVAALEKILAFLRLKAPMRLKGDPRDAEYTDLGDGKFLVTAGTPRREGSESTRAEVEAMPSNQYQAFRRQYLAEFDSQAPTDLSRIDPNTPSEVDDPAIVPRSVATEVAVYQSRVSRFGFRILSILHSPPDRWVASGRYYRTGGEERSAEGATADLAVAALEDVLRSEVSFGT